MWSYVPHNPNDSLLGIMGSHVFVNFFRRRRDVLPIEILLCASLYHSFYLRSAGLAVIRPECGNEIVI